MCAKKASKSQAVTRKKNSPESVPIHQSRTAETPADAGKGAAIDINSEVLEILDSLPFYVLLIDEGHRILLANKAVSRQLKLKPEQIVGGYCPKVVHGLDRPFPGCPLEEAASKKCAVELEVFDSHIERWLMSAIYPTTYRTRDGRAVFLHMTHDITDRKRAEEALQKINEELEIRVEERTSELARANEELRLEIDERKSSEQMLRLTQFSIDHSSEAAFWLGPDAHFIYVNEAACRALGYTREELLTITVHDIDPDFPPEVWPDHWRELRERRSFIIESRHRSKDGRIFPVEISVNLVEFEGKEYNFAFAHDISERKQAEEELRRSEEKLRRYVESSPDGIYISDSRGNFLYGNNAAERIVGYSAQELQGKNFLEVGLLPPNYLPRAARVQERNMAGQPTGPDELELIRKDGSLISVEISTYPIGEGEDTEVIGIARDITERKRAEEEKQRMQQQLQLTGRLAAVGELAAGVAHELNNPLAAVQAFAQLLASRDDLEQSIKSDVETIYKEAQRASRITTNLLSFARRHKPEKTLISINEVIEKSLELNAYRMNVNNIEVLTELDPDLPRTMADFYQMQQVFVNIITNAEQAMTESRRQGTLAIKTQKSDTIIQAIFTDDGPGIPEDILTKIFDPFFTTKDVGKGTGLGLGICFGIIQDHGGHLHAESKPGKGATFVVEIPVVTERQPADGQHESVPSQVQQG